MSRVLAALVLRRLLAHAARRPTREPCPMKRLACLALLLSASLPCLAQQVADRDFAPAVSPPAFADGKGPLVCLDEAHHNFHTLDGRFYAFGALLRRDGYVVVPSRAAFDADTLAACTVLVIANAQPSDANWNDYPLPTPSAFAPSEITAVREWVEGGGRLLLIADHMPLAGAALALAAAFDVEFTDGFAFAGVDAAATRARWPTTPSSAGATRRKRCPRCARLPARPSVRRARSL